VPNFTLIDLLGSTLAFVLFPLVLLFPGYVLGQALDIFEFKTRSRLGRLIIAIVLSNAVVPICFFLLYRYTSNLIILAVMVLFAAGFFAGEVFPLLRQVPFALSHKFNPISGYRQFAIALGFFWAIFSLLLLVNLQIGNRLYFPNVAYDYTTRVSVINAIARTGIPPVNPSYYPGHPVRLTFLYYYWYIPVSLINQIGGNYISSNQAMAAGVAWTGLAFIATIAFYLYRRKSNAKHPWHAPLIGIPLLLVSGVDIFPVLIIELKARELLGHMIFNGQIEAWNMAIMSWLNALTWVPNHISATAQCITAMLAILTVSDGSGLKRVIAGTLAGIAFASALGTSVWVTLIFVIGWTIWAAALFLSRETRALGRSMTLSGAVGAAMSLPFIHDLVQSGGSSQSGLPIAFYVRPFLLTTILVPERLQAIANLLLLPANYSMELGFFVVLGLYWLQHRSYFVRNNAGFIRAEMILLTTVILVATFVYSTVLQINDLGVRGWLLGQFVLLVWAVDVLELWLGGAPPTIRSVLGVIGKQGRPGRAIQLLLIIGILTTMLEAFSTRLWPLLVDWNVAGFPNDLSPDRHLGERTYAARLAFGYIEGHLPPGSIVQNNPNVSLDRPSGLYGDHQMVISDRTSYGVSADTFHYFQSNIAAIFVSDNSWAEIDRRCNQYAIEVLIINDLDPLWKRLPVLERERPPLYQNQYYSLVRCGGLVKP
jgi:hypothetical protein